MLLPAALSCDTRRVALLLFAPTLFVALYSLNAHKELRFVMYCAPLYTAASAIALGTMRRARWRALLVALLVSTNLALTLVALHCAAWNYAGGDALRRAHALLVDRVDVRLHVDNLAAQTGVSRFGERRDARWRYSKDERRPLDTAPYTHLLSERAHVDGFVVRDTTLAYRGIDWTRVAIALRAPLQSSSWWPSPLLRLEPSVYLLERSDNATSPPSSPMTTTTAPP